MPPARRKFNKRKPKRKTTYRKKTNAPRRMPYKSSRGKVVPYAYNVEVLQRNLPPQSTNFTNNDATASIPANFQLHMPCMFNGADENTPVSVDGNWLTPKWLKSKFRISFDNIVADHADSKKGFNLWMIQGVIKSTGEKSGADTSGYTQWTTDIKTMVGKQCLDSDLSANYLDFTKKNRNIRIIQKKLIKGNRNGTLRKAIIASTDGENFTAPSPVCLSINHALPNFKQRIDHPLASQPIMNQSYVPFVAFYCDELTRDTGYFVIEQSSRFYYTDM
jgi:hypothetical protein